MLEIVIGGTVLGGLVFTGSSGIITTLGAFGLLGYLI